MLIEWTMPNVYSVWNPNSTAPLRLMPGINEVDEKEWDKYDKHKNVLSHIEEGNLVLRNEKADPSRKKKTDGLMGFEVKECKTIIRETYDKELLAKWNTSDTRQTVKAEIEKQIEKVDKSVRVKTDEEKNG